MESPRLGALLALFCMVLMPPLVKASSDHIPAVEGYEAYHFFNYSMTGYGLLPNLAATNAMDKLDDTTYRTGCCDYYFHSSSLNFAHETAFQFDFKLRSMHRSNGQWSEDRDMVQNGSMSPAMICADPNFPVGVDEDNDGQLDKCFPKTCSGDKPTSSPGSVDDFSNPNSIWNRFINGSVDLEGNPISCSTGKKIQSDTIYMGSGPDPLSYTTHYESPKYENGSPSPTEIWNIYNGFGRTDNHFKKLDTVYSNNGFKVYRVNSKNKAGHYFYGNTANPSAKYPKSGSLVVNQDGSYTHTLPSGAIYNYNASGQLTSKTSANGLTRKYTYTTNGELETVTNHYGKALTYSYNSEGLLEKLTTPENQDYWFYYDAAKNLVKVVYPDDTPSNLNDNPNVQYLFENSLFPNHLTGKINEKGIRIATWSYDTAGRAISSEHATGLEKVELDYSVENQTKVKHYVSNTLSNEVIYHYESNYVGKEPRKQLVTYEQLTCADCVVGSWNYGYDTNGYIAKSTSPAGSVTQFTHDTNGFETQRVSAYGTAEQQTVDTVWDTAKRQVKKITKDNLQTEYFYNANNQLSSVTLTDLTSSETRTTTYTYNADGLVETIDGPRVDVSDLTTYGYDSAGNVNTITNALNHVVTLDNYDASGRVGQVTDANGVVTTMTYTPRGWLATTTANGLTTEYQYYPTGSLKKVIVPAGQTLEYFYDDGERLTAVEDNAGNRMEYTLDLMGNITKSEIKDPQGVVKFSQTQVFNALGQLAKSLGNNGQFTESVYDADGSVTTSANAKSQTTSSTLDAIKRVTKTIDAAQGETHFAYNQKNQITKVTDPENRETLYEYNNFGELTKLTSPDTGVTTYTYDDAGNLKTKTDAKNITVTYTYDVLNRLTNQTYPDTTQNVTYVYDDVTNGNKGIGRLTSVTEATGSTSYEYNAFGLIAKETRVINGKSYATSYDLDSYGRMGTITYPSGRTITYSYNALGQIDALTTDKNGTVTTLASNSAYLPFGPLSGFTFGNGINSSRNYDLDYRLKDKTNSIKVADYQYDLVNNISAISDSSNSANNRSYTYDNVNRLTEATDGFAPLGYQYDSIGNRLEKSIAPETDSYKYRATSQLESLLKTSSEPPQLSGALAEWKFNEVANSTVAQDTFNANNGTYYGNVLFEQPSDLQDNKSIYVDGAAGTYVDLGNPSALQLTSGTASAWIKTNDAGSSFATILSKSNAFGIYLWNNELIFFDYHTKKIKKTGHYLNDNKWHSIVFTFQNGVANGSNLYLDGEVVLPLTYQIKGYDGSLLLGAESPSVQAYNFTGYIDNVRMFDTVLSSQAIADLDLNVVGRVNFTYDANGNVIQKGDLSFTYNDANRMASSAVGGITTTYQYNAKGERSVKIRNGVETHFIYGPNGQLIAEADGQGNVTKEYVYFDGQPLAQIVGDDIYYYHNSHLGTPEMMTDANQNIVWQASYTPFGKATVTNESIVNNIRFPGQYYDGESGLHYNYFRDYDPEIGRYIQSDPIGLAGGINTYAYVKGNPVKYFDSTGLILEYGPEFAPLIRRIETSDIGRQIVDTLRKSRKTYTISQFLFGKCSAKYNETANGGSIKMNPKIQAWINTTDGGFTLASPHRILLHELGHAYNWDQQIGPRFDPEYRVQRDFGASLERQRSAEEQFVIDNYGNKYNDGIQRLNHEPACPEDDGICY